MPVVKFKLDRITEATGLGLEELEEALFRLKCETSLLDDGRFEVEVNPDRPDMYALEGIARAVKGVTGAETGYQPPETVDSGILLEAGHVETRPYIAAAVVYNYPVDPDTLEELIQFQEKLHDTLGRRRRKAAIGFHDLDKLPGNTVRYRMAPLSTPMKPLDYPATMTVGWVLEETEQGKKYGSLAAKDGMHPVLEAGDTVIAAPPVLNSDVTRVEPGTRNLFIDVTGTSPQLVARILDVIVSTLSYRSSVKVGLVEVKGMPWARTPLLEGKRMELDVGYASRVLGTQLTPVEAASLLERMRHRASPREAGVSVEVPPYRVDVLGEIDLVEDIAIAVGYERLGPRRPSRMMRGAIRHETRLARKLREILVGLGYTEILQLTLTSPRLVEAAGLADKMLEVANPVQQEYSVLRPSLIPSLVHAAAGNIHKAKPVRIFEIGVVAWREDGRVVEEERLGLAYMSDSAGYEDIQAPVYSLLRLLGIDFTVSPAEHPTLIPGRTASITSGGELLGWMGEVRPEVLASLGLEYPVAVAELRLEALSSRILGRG
ncbi:MAG: phenylalanine--tRNA ligase subunit beta [Desulfurococcales archaeon]|nr:phenylalanine--tRNA ligase subunit beta [Desulfurococcales archaeon]